MHYPPTDGLCLCNIHLGTQLKAAATGIGLQLGTPGYILYNSKGTKTRENS